MYRVTKTLNQKICSGITSESIKEYAKIEAKTVVIRKIVNGASYDTPRDATPEESRIIEGIISGALLSIRYGNDIQSTADSAEFIAMKLLPDYKNYDEPHINTYDTVYCPIMKWVREQEA